MQLLCYHLVPEWAQHPSLTLLLLHHHHHLDGGADVRQAAAAAFQRHVRSFLRH